jgi:hypothetical protein
MNARHLLSVSVLFAGTVVSRGAFAVCMNAYTYTPSVLGNSVIVTPDNPLRRVCKQGKAEALLRQNIATGEVVRMPDRCSGEGWLDECVPKGGYRYGFATPYVCCQACCHTDFFVEVLIQQDPPADCEANRIPDNPKPVRYTGAAPWGGAKEICGFTPAPDASPGTGSAPVDDAGRRTGYDLMPDPLPPIPGTTGTGAPGNPSMRPGTVKGGCSVAGSGTSAVIMTLGGLLAAVLFVRTSRGRRRS